MATRQPHLGSKEGLGPLGSALEECRGKVKWFDIKWSRATTGYSSSLLIKLTVKWRDALYVIICTYYYYYDFSANILNPFEQQYLLLFSQSYCGQLPWSKSASWRSEIKERTQKYTCTLSFQTQILVFSFHLSKPWNPAQRSWEVNSRSTATSDRYICIFGTGNSMTYRFNNSDIN